MDYTINVIKNSITAISNSDKLTPTTNDGSGIHYTFSTFIENPHVLSVVGVDNKGTIKGYYKYSSSYFKETYYFNNKLKKGDVLTFNNSGAKSTIEDYSIENNNITLHLKRPSGEFINITNPINEPITNFIELKYIKNIIDIIDKDTFEGKKSYYEVYIDGKPAKYPEYDINPIHNSNVFSYKEHAVDYVNYWFGVYGNMVSSNSGSEIYVTPNNHTVTIYHKVVNEFNFTQEYIKITELLNLTNIIDIMRNTIADPSIIYNYITTGRCSIILSQHSDFEYCVYNNIESIELFLEKLLEYYEKVYDNFKTQCVKNKITIDDFNKIEL